MGVSIKHIAYYLPEKIVSNEEFRSLHPSWEMDKVEEKSGVYNRHIAGDNETAFDLSCKAIDQLFASGVISKEEIGGIIFCTQSPDYIMPSNSFLVHKHFNFGNHVWTFDYNLACSGFVYGLSIARGMIETGMAKTILLITADTYSKYIHPQDRSTMVLFGDAAAATIVSTTTDEGIIDIQLSSSGKEFDSFYIPSGGARIPKTETTKEVTTDSGGNNRNDEQIHMNGFAVWKFIAGKVPGQILSLLKKNNLDIHDIDFWGFHQASKLTLDSLTKALKLPAEKLFTNLENVGNTVSASIPVLLKDAENAGKLKKGDLVLLSGFGVGLSWGSLLMRY